MTDTVIVDSAVKPSSAVHAIQMELKAQVARKNSSLSSLERALNLSRGYLSQALRGKIDLKVELVFAILEELRVKPTDFFSAVLAADLLRSQFDALVARNEAILRAGAEGAQVREANSAYSAGPKSGERDVQESLRELSARRMGGAQKGGFMEGTPGDRRFRFEEQTSGIADALEIPTTQPAGAALKETLRSFLRLLGALARRIL